MATLHTHDGIIHANSSLTEETMDWKLSLVMLGIVCVSGSIGNLLVIGVYIQHFIWPQHHRRNQSVYYLRHKKHTGNDTTHSKKVRHPSIAASDEQLFSRGIGTPTFFILVLAAVDLVACLLAVPISFYMEYIHMRPSHDIWCKVHAFITVCNIMFSCLLVIAIALDRYLAICHPLHRILTMPRAKVMTLCLGVFCIIYGVLGTQTIQLSTEHSQCTDINVLRNVTDAQKIYYFIVQKGNTASFILSILVVVILYSLILHVVIRTHRRMRKSGQLGKLQSSEHKTMAPESNLVEITASNDCDTARRENGLSTPKTDRLTSRLRSRFSIRGLTETSLWREIRSASVLFVVAVVFIIVFTPSLLTANYLVNFSLVGYNFCFLNSASNPLIYCFMSGSFRRRLRTLLCSLSSKHRDAVTEEYMFSQPRRRDRRQTTMSLCNDTDHSENKS